MLLKMIYSLKHMLLKMIYFLKHMLLKTILVNITKYF